MVITDILEPVNPTGIQEQSQRNSMHRSITPSLIKEPTSPIKVVEVIFVGLRPPERHIRDLEVCPEMARAVPVGLEVDVWPPHVVHEPSHCVVAREVLRVCCEEFDRLRP